MRTSYALEIPEMVLAECRKAEETEEVVASASSKNASSSGVLIESVRIESRLQLKSPTAWSKRTNP